MLAKSGSPVNTLAPSFLAAERTKASARPKFEYLDFILAWRSPASLESFFAETASEPWNEQRN